MFWKYKWMFFLEKKKPLLENDACFVKRQVALLLTVNNDQEEVKKRERERQTRKWGATTKAALITVSFHPLSYIYSEQQQLSTLCQRDITVWNGCIQLWRWKPSIISLLMGRFTSPPGAGSQTSLEATTEPNIKKEPENSSGALDSTQQTLLNGFYYTTLEHES